MNPLSHLSFILIGIAVLIAVHQYIFYGVWFEFSDLHHETWMIMFIFAGLILLRFHR